MNLPDFLRRDDLGEIFIAGHRVTLYHVVKCYLEEKRPDAIVEHFPTLPLALAYKVVAFYLENHDAIDKYVKTTRQEIDRQTAQPSAGPSADELKRRFEALRQAESA